MTIKLDMRKSSRWMLSRSYSLDTFLLSWVANVLECVSISNCCRGWVNSRLVNSYNCLSLMLAMLLFSFNKIPYIHHFNTKCTFVKVWKLD